MVTISDSRTARPPAAGIGITALPPQISSGPELQAPAASITVAALAPVVTTSSVVRVPAAGATIAALVPTTVGGSVVVAPVRGVTIAGLVPTVTASVGDPYFSSVSLLLHMDGSNGSTTFTDSSSSPSTVTANGNAAITTATVKYGTGALILDGVGDYLAVAAGSKFAFGTGDLTVECWVYVDTGNSNAGLFTMGGTASGLAVSIFNGNWYLTFAGLGGTLMGAVTTGAWLHLAVTRSGSSARLFINGSQLGSTLTNSTNLTDNAPKIGYYYTTAYTFKGKVDDFRITKGVARYTSNFTAPSAAFPDV